MQGKSAAILLLVLIFAANGFAATTTGSIKTDVVTISVEQQHDAVSVGGRSALAIYFELEKDWHFYASAKTAPGGTNLKLQPAEKDSRTIIFSQPIFPQSQMYLDKSSGKELEVFSDKFTVFLPFSVAADVTLPQSGRNTTVVEIGIEGATCSGLQCRPPDIGVLRTEITIAVDAAMDKPKFTVPVQPIASGQGQAKAVYSTWFALVLAFLAGLGLNIMPCVWPVLPIIVMRIIEQAKQSKGKSVVMGLAFCLGILLFFACLAGANIVLQIFYGTVLQWGDQFRNPAFVLVMSLLLVVLAMFMFGVFTIGVPSSIASKGGPGKGYIGAVGMGFLAAILSTPCSFAILVAVLAWAQAQPLLLATVAIMVIGVGMTMPYAALTSMPRLLKRLPKPGRWMELFKQAIGFVLLGIAVKLITALPQTQRMGALYFAVVLGFCVWMWGGWVSLTTPSLRKWIIRTVAVLIAVTSGMWLLPAAGGKQIDWQEYDKTLVARTVEDQRPILIEFMADWCLTCKAVEKTVYSRKEVIELIEGKGVLAIKANTTSKDNRATVDLKEVYNEPGVPVTILYLPGQSEPVRLHGLLIGGKLKEHLKNLPQKD